ncbi:hypothetical protein ABRZ24_01745 [Brenneria populi]|uniref:Uncharacterized protein n=1 Tax=Brenneria populi TaxID=1505588 RepID=A0ABU6JL01_9GAMM|nr:hypothetical protein [Brenneria populi Li et al. 2015]
MEVGENKLKNNKIYKFGVYGDVRQANRPAFIVFIAVRLHYITATLLQRGGRSARLILGLFL